MRWALLIHFLKLIAFVAIWVGTAIWFKKAPPPTISPDERMFNQVMGLVTAGAFSALIILLDRSNAWRIFKTGAVVALCATAGYYLANGDLTRGGFVGALLGTLVGFIFSQWQFRKPGV